jgi:HK97 family phage major capsid protein
MANLGELRAKYGQLVTKAKAISDGHTAEDPLSQEQLDNIDGYLGKADELRVQIDALQRVEEGHQFANAGTGTTAAHLGWREAGPQEGAEPVDAKAWREVEVKTIPTWGNPDGIVTIRYNVPIAVEQKGYRDAFESYMRKGVSDLGPQDRKTLQAAIDSAGGFLIPADEQGSILKKIATLATIRARARRISTSRDLVTWPKLVYTADNKYTSGVRLTWTGEQPASATAHRVTDPVFDIEQIPVHTAMASLPLTNNVIEDSAFDIMGVATDAMGEAFALGENDVFINGSGSNRPEGILTHADVPVIFSSPPGIYVASGAAATLTADGLIDLETRLPAQYERNAVFLMNKLTKSVIRKLKSATEELYLWPYGTNIGQFGPVPESMLGYPIAKDEFMPDVAADAFPIIFGDLSAYLIVDRVGFSMQVLRELYAETNVVVLLARHRVGGQLIESYRLRVQKCEV